MSTAANHVPRATLRAEATAAARRISPAHVAKLRAIVAQAGTINAALPILRASPDTLADALSGKVFRRLSAEAIEAKIDRVNLRKGGA